MNIQNNFIIKSSPAFRKEGITICSYDWILKKSHNVNVNKTVLISGVVYAVIGVGGPTPWVSWLLHEDLGPYYFSSIV